MTLAGKVVGFAITASHCNHGRTLRALEEVLQEGARVVPIVSYNAAELDTRFGRAEDWVRQVEELAGTSAIRTIPEAEPVGPKKLLDVLAVVPCTGNTLAKLANAVIDTPVLMACKAHLRNGRPLVLAVSTNDALGLNARNLGALLAARHVFFVPFGQDNPFDKPTSLDARFDLLVPTLQAALEGFQLQPVLIAYQPVH